MVESPPVSMIIPAYFSGDTILRCLETMMSQSYPNYEIIVVDSTPNNSMGDIIRVEFPKVTYIHSEKRLLPHAARNLGAQNSSSDLLIFTDPDIYAPRDWIENLVRAYQQYDGVIVGSLTNHTHRWLDWGIHLGKFDSFLPASGIRAIDFCATANMLCSRKDFERVGGFEGDEMLGDLLISWKFSENHIPIHLASHIFVEHHHIQTFSAFLRERYVRGGDFGRLRVNRFHWAKLQTSRHMLVTVSGLRLLGLLLREGKHSLEANLFMKFLYTLPISLLGQVMWLWGETRAYFRFLVQSRILKPA